MISKPPSGTVTFLFTDIEGSTKLWEAHRELMQAALARHDALMRQAIETNDGYVFKTVGDAFCAAFHTAPDALNAAISAQFALSTENWDATPIRVRMALHSGNTEERGGDYFGPPLNRVARLMCGHGGQVLLSQAVFDLICDQLPRNVTLRDLGDHRLKDLTRPERIYQVIALDLPSAFPALKTLDTLPNNLPIQLTSFIGREKEIEETKRLLAKTRLLTLTGAGGCGKTRLAVQVAAEVVDEFPNGVWFVELAPLADPALVPQTIAAVFGLREEQARPVLEVVIDYLHEKNLLLVLDNCEHLIDACAQLADRLLHSCPKLKILASSREALGISGEIAYRVPSLSLPPKDSSREVWQTLTQYDAVRLFIDRAGTTEPSFAITLQNAAAVAQICQRLDGIPLALELAAARVKVLSAEQISKLLDDRFKLLTGGSRAALPRQQTLRALIDWSYRLLSGAERILFRRLAVFEGGWTLEAAQSVCGSDPILEEDILDLLIHLVDKSLVLVELQGDAARYRMMETIRQFAREKLLDSGEGARLRNRHLDYFLHWVEEVEPKLKGAEQLVWLTHLEIERDNSRAALEWAVDNDEEAGLRLAGGLVWHWWLRVHWREGWEWLERLLARSEESLSAAHAKALYGGAHLSVFLNEPVRAETLAKQALRLSEALRRKDCLADSHFYLGLALLNQPRVSTRLDHYGQALQLYRELQDPWSVALVLMHIGYIVINYDQDLALAHSLLAESLTLFRQVGDRWGQALTDSTIFDLAILSRDYAWATTVTREELSLYEELGDNFGVARGRMDLGFLELAQDHYAQAAEWFEASLKTRRDFGIRSEFQHPLLGLGFVRLAQSNFAEARSFFAETLNIVDKIDFGLAVLCLDGFGQLALTCGHLARAARLVAFAQSHLQTVPAKWLSLIQLVNEQQLTNARAQLGEDVFNAAWAEGRAMTMEQAVTFALE